MSFGESGLAKALSSQLAFVGLHRFESIVLVGLTGSVSGDFKTGDLGLIACSWGELSGTGVSSTEVLWDVVEATSFGRVDAYEARVVDSA